MREPATYQRCFPARSTLPLTILLLCLGAILLPVRIQAASSGRPDNPGFQQAVADYRYLFPSDHGSHDEFRTEWWYYTGHLTAENGRRFGYQVTFFRRGIADERVRNNPSRWAIRQLYLAHAALSDRSAQRFLFAEKVSRAGLGKAGAESERLHVWIDRWAVEASTPVHDRQHLRASAEKFSLDLTLKAEKPPIVHGEGGVSRKGEGYGQASHYYSLTRLATTGTVVIDGTRLAVTGTSWMDHEFGSGDLGDNQVGWDWFSIQLHNQTELMLYRLRRADGTADPVS
ncbi:MAG: carotenoid 1,2-hydratase, partial [Nitrospiraceae bacterium]